MEITYDFGSHFVSLALFLAASLSLFLAPTFLASFFHYTFFCCHPYTLLSYGWSQVCLIRNYHVCVPHKHWFVFYISIQYIGIECGMKGNIPLLFASVVSLSCHFTPLLFKLALFTVVYSAFMRERLFYAMPSSTYSLLSKYGCVHRTQCVRYSPDGWSHSFCR